MPTSPSSRIADDLRARISAGKLGPGERLPSTRALARRHHVALATAARALQQLVREGVARALPRVGTIVAPARPAPTELHRDAIVRAAVRIADEEGLDALSMRAVAARVGSSPMALYRHVPGKDDLLAAMTEAVFAEESLPAHAPEGWRAQLELAARLEWRLVRRHPWLARAVNLTRPQPLPSALRFADWVMRALDLPGLDAGTKLRLHVLLHAHAQGLAFNLEEEARAQSESGMSEEDWMRERKPVFAELAQTLPLPAFARVISEVGAFDLDFDVLFEMGLAVFLDGVEVLIRSRACVSGVNLGCNRGTVDVDYYCKISAPLAPRLTRCPSRRARRCVAPERSAGAPDGGGASPAAP